MSVNIDGKSYPMESKNDDILYTYTYDGEPKNYYYEIAGTEMNELALIDNQPRTFNSETASLYEIYGRKYTLGDSILKTIPRLYEALPGYKKFSILFQEAQVPVIHVHMNPETYNDYVSLTSNTEPRYNVSFDFYTYV